LEQRTDQNAFQAPIEATAASAQLCSTPADQIKHVVGMVFEAAVLVYAEILVGQLTKADLVFQGREVEPPGTIAAHPTVLIEILMTKDFIVVELEAERKSLLRERERKCFANKYDIMEIKVTPGKSI